MSDRVLVVDDDANVLAGYQRQLRKEFSIEMAESGSEGLELLARKGPFAVIVSDMRMPVMDGIAFLTEVRLQSPDSIRMMLTGNADLQTCIDAVNEGSIFRFLTKPCAPELLISTIHAGIRQYKLVVSEHELLYGTLVGCLRVLTDILSIANPRAFSRGTRIRHYVRYIAAQLNCRRFWEYEMAGTLSQIGCVALPPDILARLAAGRSLAPEQRALLSGHPRIGEQLLLEIPRMNMVAAIIGRQNHPSTERIMPEETVDDIKAIEFGAQILRIALELDHQLLVGASFIDALHHLHTTYGPDHPIVEALMGFQKDDTSRVRMLLSADALSTGMVAGADILSVSGAVLVTKGQNITQPIRLYLQSCAQAGGLVEPFEVDVVPSGTQS